MIITLNTLSATGSSSATGGIHSHYVSFQSVITSTSTGYTASINHEASNNGSNWFTLATVTLSSADNNDGFVANNGYAKYRSTVSAISTASASIVNTLSFR